MVTGVVDRRGAVGGTVTGRPCRSPPGRDREAGGGGHGDPRCPGSCRSRPGRGAGRSRCRCTVTELVPRPAGPLIRADPGDRRRRLPVGSTTRRARSGGRCFDGVDEVVAEAGVVGAAAAVVPVGQGRVGLVDVDVARGAAGEPGGHGERTADGALGRRAVDVEGACPRPRWSPRCPR